MNTVPCTGAAFRGLTDPYDGSGLEVVMTVGRGAPLFAAPRAKSPATRYPTAEERDAAWRRPLVCAYTGGALTPVSDDYGHSFSGGFDPRVFRPREEFLYYATMRGGRSAYASPSASPQVASVRAKPDRQVLAHPVETRDEAMDFAEQAMKDARYSPPRKTRVTVKGRAGK